MLIRKTKRFAGIEKYLETGQKKGRDYTRDEADKRVYLGGDLGAFASANQLTRNTKKWTAHYTHDTISFLDEETINIETMKKINDEILDFYYPIQDKNKLFYYSEAHLPKIQNELDKVTGEIKSRKLHQHLIVSLYDQETGNQIRRPAYSASIQKVFQSYLCHKYKLIDPSTRKRGLDEQVTMKDIIAKHKNDKDCTKQTRASRLRKVFKALLKDVNSIEQAKKMLLETGIVSGFRYVETKNNRYIKVKLKDNKEDINIRGKGFEKMEELYYSKDELNDNNNIKERTFEDNERIVKEQKEKWIKRLKDERDSIKKPYTNYEKMQKLEKKYDDFYKKYTKEQRIFFVIYKKNIQEEEVNGYKIWEKNNERFLINTDKKIKIYDRPDKISLDLPDGQKERQEAIKLALSVAVSKGWDIDKMSVNGSHSLKKEVRRQIVELKADKAKVEVKEQKIEKKKEKKKLPPNSVTQSLTDAKEKQIERLSKEQIQSIKDKLNANILLKYAEHKYNILISDFEITNDNKINDKRNKQKPKNVIDFMTKTCNISFKEVLPKLHKLYIEQEKKENTAKMKIGISNDKSLASVENWQEKEITTFTELANTIKNNNYSAVTKFKDNYRKIANVEQLSNIAIFDIDNDPNYPELSIKKAKELLKNTTYLLITSKSHQIKKGDKPAVDRFRIIVPLKQSFEANKVEYRASMTRLAENLGLAQYIDKKALSDMVRFYYKSPSNAYFFINNTKNALDVQTIKESVQADMAEKQRLQAEKLKDSSEALNRENNGLKQQILANSEDYHTMIDVDAMNKLPLDYIYQKLTGNEIKDDGSSYRIAKGFEAGTSSNHDTLSFIDGTQLAHDFKTNNTHNVVTMLKEIKGFNVYESASYLEKEFNVNLKVPNPIYYQKIIAKAIGKSTNDKTLKENIKEISGAKFVKLDFKNEQIQIADKCFSFNNLDIKKENMIAQLKENRNREAEQEQQPSRQRM